MKRAFLRYFLRGVEISLSAALLVTVATLPIWLPVVMVRILGAAE